MEFINFLSSTSGRLLRVVAGTAMVVIGVLLGGGWYVLAVAGLLPLFAGLSNVCLFAPLFGQPFKGDSARPSSLR